MYLLTEYYCFCVLILTTVQQSSQMLLQNSLVLFGGEDTEQYLLR